MGINITIVRNLKNKTVPDFMTVEKHLRHNFDANLKTADASRNFEFPAISERCDAMITQQYMLI